MRSQPESVQSEFESSQISPGTNLLELTFLDILIIATVSLLLSLPVLIRGPLPAGHDTIEHLNFARFFAQQFWAGDLYPRWLQDLNHGLGSATFFVYPPFPPYVSTLLQPVGKLLHLNSFNLAEFLCLFSSGICAFLWIGTMASRRVSLVVAVLYLLLPYHLSVDFYLRSALSESWGMAWMPLVLFFATQVANRKRGAIVRLGVAYALVIVSHLMCFFIFLPLPPLLALLIAKPSTKIRVTASVIGGMLLGAGLSAAYLLPALWESRYFPPEALRLGSPPNEFWLLVFGRGILGHPNKSPFLIAVSAITIDMALFIAVCGLLVLLKCPPTVKKHTLFWLAVCVGPLFMMSRRSIPVWSAFPSLGTRIQFPMRLDVILCLAALPIAAFFLSRLSWPLSAEEVVFSGVAILLVGSWLVAFALTMRVYSSPAQPLKGADENDGWFRAWTPPGTDDFAALAESAGPRARFLGGDGRVTVLQWSPRNLKLQTDCSACDSVMVHQFYYPEWKSELLPENRPLRVEPSLPTGLLTVEAPPGKHQIRIEIPRTVQERVGNWLSLLSAVLCVVWLAVARTGELVPAHSAPET